MYGYSHRTRKFRSIALSFLRRPCSTSLVSIHPSTKWSSEEHNASLFEREEDMTTYDNDRVKIGRKRKAHKEVRRGQYMMVDGVIDDPAQTDAINITGFAVHEPAKISIDASHSLTPMTIKSCITDHSRHFRLTYTKKKAVQVGPS